MEPGEKTLEPRREPTTNSTHKWHLAGVIHGPHWCKASAFTTAPYLLIVTVAVKVHELSKGSCSKV